jgi:ABC-type nickel/cobalt efflux system permease component RcnA
MAEMKLLLGIVLAVLLAFPLAAQDPFRAGRPAAPVAPKEAPATGFIATIAETQKRLNDELARQLRLFNAPDGRGAALAVLALSFLYGVLHAAGPGHGKAVVASYLLARREDWRHGVLVGAGISLVQGLSAILAVAVLAAVLGVAQREILGSSALVETVSYALVTVIGLHLLWRAVMGHDHQHHGGDHHHHHAPPRRDGSWWRMVLAAGLTPCASAIIVLLFALANGVLAAGIAAALAMSIGMGMTVSAIGIATVFGRRAVERLAGSVPSIGPRVERGVALGGALLLVGFSGLMLLGAASRL